MPVLSETVADVDFAAFYRAERRSLVRFVMFLGCADADMAEDIAQTAFARAFPVWTEIRIPQAWLRKVAQNEFFRHCRAAARETSLEAAPERADRVAGVSVAMALEQQADTREVAGRGDRGPAAEAAAGDGLALGRVQRQRDRRPDRGFCGGGAEEPEPGHEEAQAVAGADGEGCEVSRQRWRTGATRITDDQVNARVARARADIAAILGNVLDDEAGLARIYAMHGRQVPAAPGPAGAGDDEGGQVQAVCDRIAMLESALAQAASPDAPSSQARMYLSMGRQFLFELRSGLASRSLAAEDAFRLLSNVRHDLREADSTLRQGTAASPREAPCSPGSASCGNSPVTWPASWTAWATR